MRPINDTTRLLIIRAYRSWFGWDKTPSEDFIRAAAEVWAQDEQEKADAVNTAKRGVA